MFKKSLFIKLSAIISLIFGYIFFIGSFYLVLEIGKGGVSLGVIISLLGLLFIKIGVETFRFIDNFISLSEKKKEKGVKIITLKERVDNIDYFLDEDLSDYIKEVVKEEEEKEKEKCE